MNGENTKFRYRIKNILKDKLDGRSYKEIVMANGTCYKTIRKLNDFSNSMRWTCYEDIEDTVPELIYQLYKDYSLGKDSVLPDLEKIYVLHEIQHKNLKTIHRELDTSLSYQSLCRHYRYYMKSKKKMNENGRKKDR